MGLELKAFQVAAHEDEALSLKGANYENSTELFFASLRATGFAHREPNEQTLSR